MAETTGQNGTVLGRVERLSQSLIGALPPAFLLLLAINAGFLGLVLWFVSDQMDSRASLAAKILDHCLDLAAKAH